MSAAPRSGRRDRATGSEETVLNRYQLIADVAGFDLEPVWSIAWVDNGRDRPMSASSDPGPACCSFGGDQPTVTDADLVLGHFDRQISRWKMALSHERAAAAIKSISRSVVQR
jgi:hypothetical protein